MPIGRTLARGGITIAEEAHTGTVISGRLLTIANEIRSGDLGEAAAIAEARELIRTATAPGAAANAATAAGY